MTSSALPSTVPSLDDARPWTWHHDPGFEHDTINALHHLARSFLAWATFFDASYGILDYLSAPASAQPTVFALRLLSAVNLVICTLILHNTRPGAWTTPVAMYAPLSTSVIVAIMTLQWDPGHNLYGSGIVVPMVTFGFLTCKPLHTLAGGVFISVFYPTVNLLFAEIPREASVALITHSSIVSGACVLMVLLAERMHRLRWRSYCQQKMVEQERETIAQLAASLEIKVQERTAQLRQTNEALSRFVPSEFLRTLGYSDITQAKLGDACLRNLTVLFADVRNFTTLSEQLSPEETLALLNGCLSQLGPCVRRHGGFVDKYIGDAIMALFPGEPSTALAAANDMIMALEKRNETMQHGTLGIGIGIHTGSVMMGTIGEEERFEATVIADAVNIAARIESLTRQLGCSILVGGSSVDSLSEAERASVRWVGRVMLKGKDNAVDLYECFGGERTERQQTRQAYQPAFEYAVKRYLSGEVSEALEALRALADAAPEDGPTGFWYGRCLSDVRQHSCSVSAGALRLDSK